MDSIIERLKAEPARVVGFVVAALTLATALGVEITTEQNTAIVGAVTAILALIGAEVTRSKVSPVRDAPDHRDFSDEGTPYDDAPAGDGL